MRDGRSPALIYKNPRRRLLKHAPGLGSCRDKEQLFQPLRGLWGLIDPREKAPALRLRSSEFLPVNCVYPSRAAHMRQAPKGPKKRPQQMQ
jgi:hypothetical protein